jgi:DNA-binding transcriptional regulator PaaX
MDDSLRSEDWLGLFLYGLDLLLNPKPYKYLQNFEQWDYKNRFRQQLYGLQRANLLEHRKDGAERSWSLTPRGRLEAWGGVDPQERWQRPWDGKWRTVMFDLPARSHQLRLKLWRWLRGQRFGLLQQSVWVTPDSIDEATVPLDRFKLPPSALIVIEGHCAPPALDADVVNGAWDFNEINARYREVLELSARGRQLAKRPDARPAEFGQWLAAERNAWRDAVSRDPLLPASLLPSGYLGRQAWSQRQSGYRAVAERGVKATSQIV